MSESVDVTLRLKRGSGVPSGEVVADGVVWSFHGWLELLGRLEQARAETEPEDDSGSR